jgi:hypothetical protein
MRTLKIGIVLSVISAVTLVAVGGPDNPYHSKEKSDIAALVDKEAAAIKADSDTDDKEKARHLAKIGQLLLETPKGAVLALGVFEEALSYDNQNVQANFFAAILKPIHTLKGFPFKLTKIVGVVEMGKAIEDILSGIRNKDTQNLVDDLLQGADPRDMFRLPSDVQKYLVAELLPVLKSSEERLSIVEKTEHFRVKVNYKNWQASWHLKQSVSFDEVEVHALRVALKGISTEVKMISSYNVDAGMALRNQFKNRRHLTMKEVIAAINEHTEALVLNKGGRDLLTSILDDVSESVEGLRIIARLLNTEESREDFLLKPFTSEEEYASFIRGLNMTSDALSGPITLDIGDEDGSVVFDFTALLANPVENLKSLFPTEFNDTGKRTVTFPDLSFGGTVPNKDLISTYCSLDEEERKIHLPVECR